MNKGGAVARLIIYAVVALMLTGLLVAALVLGGLSNLFQNWNWFSLGTYHYSDADSYEAGDRQIKDLGVKELEIHWISGEVRLEITESSTLTCREEGNKDDGDTMRTRYKDGVLTVQFARSGYSSVFKGHSKTLTVEVPVELLGSLRNLRIEAVSARILSDGIHADRIEIEEVSGKVDLKNTICESISFEAVSGDLTLSGAADVIEYETVSGQMELRLGNMPRSLQCETVSGSVNWYLPMDEGFRVRMSKVSGRFSSDLAFTEDGSWRIFGDGAHSYEMATVSGNLTVRQEKLQIVDDEHKAQVTEE